MSSSEFFTAADGTRIAYRQFGEGEPLVCLPGGPGRAGRYLRELGGLDRTRRLVVLDHRGTGSSAMPEDRDTLAGHHLAEDALALLDHLGLDRADILAHSAGCVVAHALVLLAPERVRRLVLVTPGSKLFGGRSDDAELRAARSGEPWYAEAADAFDRMRTTSNVRELGRLWPRLEPFGYAQWNVAARAHAAARPFEANPFASQGFWTEELLRRLEPERLAKGCAALESPVLVVGGALDGFTGVAICHTVAEQFPAGSVRVIADCAHFPWVDQPAEFAATVEEFLSTTE